MNYTLPAFSRRRFATAVGSLAITGALAGCTGNEESGDADDPDQRIHKHMQGANLYAGDIEDETGEDEVVIQVGGGDEGVAFDPPAVRIYAEATVHWEWTGAGGAHNVASVDGSDEEFRSGNPISGSGETFDRSFDGGVQLYVCEPHQGSGMRGAIEVIAPSGGRGGGY